MSRSDSTVMLPVGQRVIVSWMGARIGATVSEAKAKGGNGRLLREPIYRLTLDAAVVGGVWYSHSEIEVAE